MEIAVPLLARDLRGLDTDSLDTDSFEIDTIVDSCGGLVVADPGSGTMRLAHFTISQWMHHKTLNLHTTSNLDLNVAERKISLVCINYISTCALASMSIDEQFRVFPFMSYAVRSWAYHAGKQESPRRVAEFLKMTKDFWLAALKHDSTVCVTYLLHFLWRSLLSAGFTANSQ